MKMELFPFCSQNNLLYMPRRYLHRNNLLPAAAYQNFLLIFCMSLRNPFHRKCRYHSLHIRGSLNRHNISWKIYYFILLCLQNTIYKHPKREDISAKSAEVILCGYIVNLTLFPFLCVVLMPCFCGCKKLIGFLQKDPWKVSKQWNESIRVPSPCGEVGSKLDDVKDIIRYTLEFRPLAGKRVPNPCPHSPLFMRLSEPICGGERVSCFSAGSKVKNSPQSLILCGAAEN